MTKTEKAYAMTDIAMEEFGEVPADFSSFINDQIKPYLFYSQKEKICYCTKCHEEMTPWKGLKHKEKAVCPKCGTQATAKAIGLSRLTPDVLWTSIAEGYSEGVRTRHFRTLVDWDNFRHPIVETTEMFRGDVTKKSYHDYMWWHDSQGKYRWMPYKQRGYSWQFSSEIYEPTDIHYYGDLGEVLKSTPFKYCPVDKLMPLDKGTWLEGWLNCYKQLPQLEWMAKVGFNKLIKWCRSWGARPLEEFDPEGKDIYETLKVSKAEYKLLLRIGDPTIDDLRATKRFKCTTLEDLRFCQSFSVWDADRKLAHVLTYVTKAKLKKYFVRENIINLTNYDDYVTWLEELHYPMEEYYLFPADFKEAHDRLAGEKRAKADRIAKERKALQKKLMAKLKADKDGVEAFHMHYGGLFIRIAESPEELIEEGKTLHHCVGTYVDRVARGETTILFVRKEEAPEVPFYTMEFKEGHVTQLYGKYDCRADEQVEAFKKEFEKRISKEFGEEKAA